MKLRNGKNLDCNNLHSDILNRINNLTNYLQKKGGQASFVDIIAYNDEFKYILGYAMKYKYIRKCGDNLFTI
jgi:hypothetical protein